MDKQGHWKKKLGTLGKNKRQVNVSQSNYYSNTNSDKATALHQDWDPMGLNKNVMHFHGSHKQ